MTQAAIWRSLVLARERFAAEPDHGVPVGRFYDRASKQPPALIERVIPQDDVNIRATVLTNRLIFVGVGKIACRSVCAVERPQQRFDVDRRCPRAVWVTGMHGRLKRVAHSRSRQATGPPRRRNGVREARRSSGTRHPPKGLQAEPRLRVRNLLQPSRSFGPGESDRRLAGRTRVKAWQIDFAQNPCLSSYLGRNPDQITQGTGGLNVQVLDVFPGEPVIDSTGKNLENGREGVVGVTEISRSGPRRAGRAAATPRLGLFEPLESLGQLSRPKPTPGVKNRRDRRRRLDEESRGGLPAERNSSRRPGR